MCLHNAEGWDLSPSLPLDSFIDVLAGVHNARQRHHNPHPVDNHKVEPEVEELWPGVTLNACMTAQSRGMLEHSEGLSEARLGGAVALCLPAATWGWCMETNNAAQCCIACLTNAQDRCTPW